MKGLIIAAGYGTRFLPVTKTVPKEMLPLITKPAVSFIVEEMMAAGIREFVVVTSRRKRALEDFLDREVELEELFSREGAGAKLEAVRPYDAHFSFVRQQRMLGTGDALLQAAPLIGEEPFVVAYPDDLHFGTPPLARQLVEKYEKTGASVMATLHDPPDLNRYGVLEIAEDGRHVRDIVEKPEPGKEPSREASIGRYLFTPDIFPLLREGWEAHLGGHGTAPGGHGPVAAGTVAAGTAADGAAERTGSGTLTAGPAGASGGGAQGGSASDSGGAQGGGASDPGEYYHTYALRKLMQKGNVVHHPIEGRRLDTGSPRGYLEAILSYASGDPDLRDLIARFASRAEAQQSKA